ncbi:tetratricopeptide repeat protein [Chitinophagaceae bacterium LB-8]|uniref:Tetratricopeptide repeat protein n=1 Tax=Paraflavisolibacter caeni TaxID=2982496 RepID=A0A9X2XVV0_9BACT|nr:tetratricopeptide repeat protein [Paraflavisolibacter caeni]MCU7549571.1 tetratricopeptide repeat protein [Paraflavisolibacter caeni]
MLKTITITTAFVLTSFLAFSQNYEKQFNDLSAKNDTGRQAKVLAAWATASPKDPELFIAYFNYYVSKSMTEVVSLDRTKKDEHSFVLTDTGTGKPVAFLNSSVKYNSELLQKGFDYINQGISLHTSRLDMRFGKIYMLGKAENYPEFTKEIVSTIDYGNKINNAWTWKEGKPLENPEQIFLGSLQDYVTTIYNTGDDNLLPLMRQISEAVIKYYPDHVESLSNIALTYLIAGDYDKTLPYLLKAEEIAPKDIIVLNNIAETYKRKGDKTNAKAYYEKVIKYGGKEEAQDARQKIKGL